MMATVRTSRMATACLLAVSTLGMMASAQEMSVGIVRVSDSKSGIQPAFHSKGEYHSAPGYDQGYGYSGDCPHCHGAGKNKGGKFCEHYCTHSADHGYSIPGKWPIHRRGVQYQSLFPQQWYSAYTGNYGIVGAPQVYTPTDTTQLGYYYQHVPYWQPSPNPLPARPVPAQWHHYAPAVYASQWGLQYSKDGWTEGEVIYETAPAAAPAPAPAPNNLQPVPEPAPENALPPKPLQESAVPLPLQRVGY